MRDHLDLARNRLRATSVNFSNLDDARQWEASAWAREADEHVRDFDAILAALNPKPVDPLVVPIARALDATALLGDADEADVAAFLAEMDRQGLTITRKGEEG